MIGIRTDNAGACIDDDHVVKVAPIQKLHQREKNYSWCHGCGVIGLPTEMTLGHQKRINTWGSCWWCCLKVSNTFVSKEGFAIPVCLLMGHRNPASSVKEAHTSETYKQADAAAEHMTCAERPNSELKNPYTDAGGDCTSTSHLGRTKMARTLLHLPLLWWFRFLSTGSNEQTGWASKSFSPNAARIF